DSFNYISPNSLDSYTKSEQLTIQYLIQYLWSNDKESLNTIFTKKCNNSCTLDDYLKLVKNVGYGEKLSDSIFENGILSYFLSQSFGSNSYTKVDDSLYRSVYSRIENECFRDRECPSLDELNDLEIFVSSNNVKLGELMYLFDYQVLTGSIDEFRSGGGFKISNGNKYFELTYKVDSFTKGDIEKLNTIMGISNDEKILEKDYTKLLEGKEIKDVPLIYKQIPNDSMFVHIKNPKSFFSLLDKTDNVSGYSIDVIKKGKELFMGKLGVKDESALKESIKGEIVIIMTDFDLINPGVVFIMDQGDIATLDIGKSNLLMKASNGKVYLGFSQRLLDKITSLDEKDSVYNSNDFKYSWSKHGAIFKDMLFFAGDKYFAKLLSFENYDMMFTKYLEYNKLRELEYYMYIYKSLNGTTPTSLKQIYDQIGLDAKDYSSIELKDGKLQSTIIGTLDNLKNYGDIDNAKEVYSRDMVFSYQFSVAGYRAIWRSFLDPVSIVLNANGGEYDLDFMMTPLPSFQDSSMEELIKYLQGYGIEKFDLWEDKRLRQGFLGFEIGLDFDSLLKNLEDGKDSNRELRSIFLQNEIIGDMKLANYIGNEIYLGLGNIDPNFFRGYDFNKLDLFLAVEFKSFLKAEEFMQNIIKNIGNESSMFRGYIGSIIKDGIIKPLIEEYNGHNIYYIPIEDTLKIHYVILDKFVYISASKDSLKSSIDYFNNGKNNSKSLFVNKINQLPKKLFAIYFDSEEFLRKINENFGQAGLENSKNIAEIISFYAESKIDFYKSIISKHRNQYEFEKIKGGDLPVLAFEDKYIRLTSKDDKVFMSVNADFAKANLDDKSILDGMFSEEQVRFLVGENTQVEITDEQSSRDYFQSLSYLFSSNLDNLTKLFTNFVLGFNIGDDEIQMIISTGGKKADFKDAKPDEGILKPFVAKVSKDNFLYFLGIGGPLMLLFAIAIYMLNIKKKDEFKD
ncbi:MAG: hypothetical protein V3575_02265, partial [Candidatus Absconditabacteria bacterium]